MVTMQRHLYFLLPSLITEILVYTSQFKSQPESMSSCFLYWLAFEDCDFHNIDITEQQPTTAAQNESQQSVKSTFSASPPHPGPGHLHSHHWYLTLLLSKHWPSPAAHWSPHPQPDSAQQVGRHVAQGAGNKPSDNFPRSSLVRRKVAAPWLVGRGCRVTFYVRKFTLTS